jgi:hypothetical protein
MNRVFRQIFKTPSLIKGVEQVYGILVFLHEICLRNLEK